MTGQCSWCCQQACEPECASNKVPNPEDLDYCLGWIRLQLDAANESVDGDEATAHNIGVLDRAVMHTVERLARLGAAVEAKIAAGVNNDHMEWDGPIDADYLIGRLNEWACPATCIEGDWEEMEYLVAIGAEAINQTVYDQPKKP